MALPRGACQNDPRRTGGCATQHHLPEATSNSPRQGVLFIDTAAASLALHDCGKGGATDVIPRCDDTKAAQTAVQKIRHRGRIEALCMGRKFRGSIWAGHYVVPNEPAPQAFRRTGRGHARLNHLDHFGQYCDIGFAVEPVPTPSMPIGPESVALTPAAQGRRRNAQSRRDHTNGVAGRRSWLDIS